MAEKLVLANKGFNTQKAADDLANLVRQPNNLNIRIQAQPNASADEIAAAMRTSKFTPQEQALPVGVPFKITGFSVATVSSASVTGATGAFMHYEIDGKSRAISFRRVANELPMRVDALGNGPDADDKFPSWNATTLETFRKYAKDRGTAKQGAQFSDPTTEGDVLGAALLKACMDSPTGQLIVRDRYTYQENRKLSGTNRNNAGRAGETVTIVNDLYVIDVHNG